MCLFENRVLRRIFESKRDEITVEWRRLYNAELNDLYLSQNIIRVIKSRRMKWTGYVAHMGDRRGAFKVWVGSPDRKKTTCKTLS